MAAITQSQFAAALFAREAAPPGLTTARGEADASRFAVYRNNVAVALIKALEGRFPVTRRVVGDGFFRMMAHAFIEKNKPSSPLIFEYGAEMPDFISGFEPARQLSYLPDLARIEAAWTSAYHAAEAPVVTAADLAAIADDLAGCRLVAHPSTFLIASAHPAGSIWAANQASDVAPLQTYGPETILVARPFADVHVHILPAQDTAFVQHLFAGHSLGDAGQEALSRNERFDFGTALVGLASLGAFTSIQTGRTR
ncbi:MAG: putative DNA-binding domain-containing protein [Rhizobiaceae bacterium]|nr:putative DNA-binding domain-containing protein [Rhizobiaceae bacterium]